MTFDHILTEVGRMPEAFEKIVEETSEGRAVAPLCERVVDGSEQTPSCFSTFFESTILGSGPDHQVMVVKLKREEDSGEGPQITLKSPIEELEQ